METDEIKGRKVAINMAKANLSSSARCDGGEGRCQGLGRGHAGGGGLPGWGR